jgi:small conductance mechanosensitive channel
VTIGGVTGTVEELGMRITRLRDDDGRLYILSNGDIGQVCNMSRGPLAGVLEVAIAASADVGHATQVLNDAFAHAADKNGLNLAEPARVEGVAAVDAAKTVLRVRFRAKPNERPGDATLRLRDAARVALRDAEIGLA